MIATKDRPWQLERCLRSLLKSSEREFEILITDQSRDHQTEQVIERLASNKIVYLRSERVGKAKELNTMVDLARSKILAFTDDDCLIDKNWLKEISRAFAERPKLAGVFGNTFPYQPARHPDRFCPATFSADQEQLHTDPAVLHYLNLGQGNNMSLRKSVIKKIGGFKEWLGVGTPAQAGEESDLIFRILLAGYSLANRPKMVVYHDRWLTRSQDQGQQSRYTRGLIAFFVYHLFNSNQKYAKGFFRQRLNQRALPLIKEAEQILIELVKIFIFLIWEVLAIVRGSLIGLAMVIREKIGF